MARITQDFPGYNPRRYGRPWIARVTSWPIGGRPQMEFGRYLGDDAGGEAEISAEDGDVIRWGQKDYRGRNTTAQWGIVTDDGCVTECHEPEARRAWGQIIESDVAEQTDTPSVADLQRELAEAHAEIERLKRALRDAHGPQLCVQPQGYE